MLQKHNLIIFLFFLSTIIEVSGQKTSSNVYDLLQKTKGLVVENPDKAKQIIDSLKQSSEINENNRLLIQLYELESQLTFIFKDYNNAFRVLKKIDSLLITSSEMSRLASNYNRWGILLTKMGVYENALDYLLKSYKIRKNLEESETLINTLSALAALYAETNQADMAKSTIRSAFQQLKSSNDAIQKAMVFNNAGFIEGKFGLTDSAMFYYRKALKIQQISKNNIGKIQTYQNISDLFLKKEMFDSAFYYAFSALTLAKNLNSKQDIVSLKLTLSEILFKQSQFDNAELLLVKIYPEIELSQNYIIKKRAYNLLSTIYYKKNDLQKALQFAYKSMSIIDSLITEEREKKMSQLTFVYKMEEREREIEIQQKLLNAKVKQIVNKYVLVIAILIVTTTAIIVLLIKNRKKISKLNLQLDYELAEKKQLEQKHNSLEQKHLLVSSGYEKLAENEHKFKGILKTKYESVDFLSNNMPDHIKTIIRFSSDMLSDNNLGNEQKMYLEKIHNTAKSLERVLIKIAQSNTSDFSSFFDYDICDLDVIAAEVTKYAKEKLIGNDFLELVLSFPQTPNNYKLYSNQNAIIKAFEYLIDNVFSFKKQGVVKVGYKVANNQIRFYVDDSRINISIGAQTAIYQWQNADVTLLSSLNDQDKPVLFSACQAINSINSYLSFETSNSWGNMFYFILPLKRVNTSKQKNEDVFPIWSGKHILIAEDEFLNFEVLRNYLKPTNVRISHARHGFEILEMVKVFKFDLIIMDIKMPQMDGIDTIQELRKLSNKIPVIAQTAHASESQRINFLQMGFAEFLLKPINKYELYQIIDKIFMLSS